MITLKSLIIITITIEILIIASISTACALGGGFFYLFYNGIYGILLSVALPYKVYVTYVRGERLSRRERLRGLGLTRPGTRQFGVIAAFVALSIGGQAIPLVISGARLEWNRLVIGFLPLVMTTFFEEFLFRGFLQTRFERLMGAIPAILLSGLCFSLYHLGYPGFRTFSDIALLFAVGTGFALAYKLAGNNLFAAYFVNLPNALLTYMLKYEQFPVFDWYSVAAAGVCIATICFAGRRILCRNA